MNVVNKYVYVNNKNLDEYLKIIPECSAKLIKNIITDNKVFVYATDYPYAFCAKNENDVFLGTVSIKLSHLNF